MRSDYFVEGKGTGLFIIIIFIVIIGIIKNIIDEATFKLRIVQFKETMQVCC